MRLLQDPHVASSHFHNLQGTGTWRHRMCEPSSTRGQLGQMITGAPAGMRGRVATKAVGTDETGRRVTLHR